MLITSQGIVALTALPFSAGLLLDTYTYFGSVLPSYWLMIVLNQLSDILNTTSASLSFIYLLRNRGLVIPYLLITVKKNEIMQCFSNFMLLMKFPLILGDLIKMQILIH